MDILTELLKTFVLEHKYSAGFIVVLSFLVNFIQVNGISLVTSKILQFAETKNKTQAFQYFHYFILLFVLSLVIIYIFKLTQNNVLTTLRHWLRHELLKSIFMINKEEMDEMNFTSLSSPVNRISASTFSMAYNIINVVLPNFTLFIFISIYFLYKNVFFGILFIITNMIAISYIWYKWDKIVKMRDNYEKYINESETTIIDMLNNLDKIIHRGNVDNELDDFSIITEKGIHNSKEYYSEILNTVYICRILIFIIICISIYSLLKMHFAKEITLTMFMALFTILLFYEEKFTFSIHLFPDFMDFVSRYNYALELISKMKACNVDRSKKYNKVNLPFDNIRYDKVSFKYDTGNRMVFDDLSMSIKLDNHIIGITGVSGTGKSTFVKLLLKLYKPLSGDIFIDDVNIKEIDGEYIRTNITYINQNTKLFDKTIIDNILYGCQDKDHCNTNLDIIMKYPKISAMFKSIDIHKESAGLLGENLSGGQRQIVNFISGLVLPSKIVIIDEPTNALDKELKNEIIQLIRDFKQHKKCIFVISHDADVVKIYDKKIEL